MAAGSIGRATAAVALVCLLLGIASIPLASAMTCSQVVPNIAPCVAYIRGGKLTDACCNGVRRLNNLAQSKSDRQSACACLKNAASHIHGISSGRVSGLPSSCGVKLSFTVSANVDCSTVQ